MQLLPCSVFFVGYTISNIAGGYLATRYTAKLVLGLGVLVWSAFTIATPLAAASGDIFTLLACRTLMGVGEGVTFPAIQHLTSSWVPRRQRSRANSLVYSGDAGREVTAQLAGNQRHSACCSVALQGDVLGGTAATAGLSRPLPLQRASQPPAACCGACWGTLKQQLWGA